VRVFLVLKKFEVPKPAFVHNTDDATVNVVDHADLLFMDIKACHKAISDEFNGFSSSAS
jgi:hypothetical protein